ncbi:MAG: S1 RNA-binding domain-containing protein [Clostridiales bacterium]|nr:S1 RNA-binding domain-containing protein [Clostridiales bacterium]
MLEVGAIVDGKVTRVADFGAFVDIGDGKSGMVHISEVSTAYVNNIHDHVSVGQEVKVKILSIGDDGKISLSMKKAVPSEEKASAPPKPRHSSAPNVWQGVKPSTINTGNSFEDMMARFKQISDEKMTDLKRTSESKHGGGYSRRGGNNNR